jgi:hypothetical protein
MIGTVIQSGQEHSDMEYLTAIPAGWKWVLGPNGNVYCRHPDNLRPARVYDAEARQWMEYREFPGGFTFIRMEPQPDVRRDE